MKFNNIGQKIKGRAEQIKGKIEDKSGEHLKGNIDVIRGKLRESAADMKMRIGK
jgi:uncharacterized protein YjbJ (UPF0337 family)